MTSNDEFMTPTAAAKYIGETVERTEQLILQGIIDAEMPGRGVSRQSCDYWRANQKAKHNGAMQTKIAPRGKAWSAEEDAILIKEYWPQTFDALCDMFPERSPGSISGRVSRLMASRRIPKNPPGYMRTARVARKYHVCQSTISDAAKDGKIRGVRRGGVWYVNADDCEKMFGDVAPALDIKTAPVATAPTYPVGYISLTDAAKILPGITRGALQNRCLRGKIPCIKVPCSRGCGGAGYQWAVPETIAESFATPAPAAPVENIPVFVRNRRAAESKDRAAFRAKLKAELPEPGVIPEATVETAPVARGGLLARVAAACAILKRGRA